MGKLTCISWNIRGINSPIKRKKMLTYLKRQKVDIAFIQESHLTDSEHLKLCRDWVGNVFYSSFSSKARGVALLINKHLNFKLNSVEKDKNGRFLLVDCEINRNKISLVNIYGPNYDDPSFFNNLIMKLRGYNWGSMCCGRRLQSGFKSSFGSITTQNIFTIKGSNSTKPGFERYRHN